MLELKATTSHATAKRLQRLAKLYEQGQASRLMERTLQKLMSYEIELCHTHLAELHQDLAALEQQYGWSSAEFYERYQAGQTDDRIDYVEWASLVQMTENLQARLRVLKGDESPPTS